MAYNIFQRFNKYKDNLPKWIENLYEIGTFEEL